MCALTFNVGDQPWVDYTTDEYRLETPNPDWTSYGETIEVCDRGTTCEEQPIENIKCNADTSNSLCLKKNWGYKCGTCPSTKTVNLWKGGNGESGCCEIKNEHIQPFREKIGVATTPDFSNVSQLILSLIHI